MIKLCCFQESVDFQKEWFVKEDLPNLIYVNFKYTQVSAWLTDEHCTEY